jgi:hypothetical protein
MSQVPSKHEVQKFDQNCMKWSICIKILMKWYHHIFIIGLLWSILCGVHVSEGCTILRVKMWSTSVWGLYNMLCCLRAKLVKSVLIGINSCAELNHWIFPQGVCPLVIIWDEVAVLGCCDLCHIACPLFEGCSPFLLPDECTALVVSFKAFFSYPFIRTPKREKYDI